MKTTCAQRREDGIALIIVMIVVVVLAMMAGAFALAMKVEAKLARNATWDTDLEWMGRSGIELARYVLGNTGTGPAGQVDSLNQKWAGGPGQTNEPLADIDLNNYPLGPGVVSVKIVDEDRKFNINVADEVILKQALTLVGVDASLTPTIVDSILDWRDPDNDTHSSGTESDYYSHLDPPYRAKNGRLDDITELLLIKGVSPAMFWGANANLNARRKPKSARDSVFDEPIYQVGLKDLFTPLSSGLINLNTASATALQIIPAIDENTAQAIIQRRAGPDGQDGTEDDMPFRTSQELSAVPGMNPQAVAQFARLFGVRSAVFHVTVVARIGSFSRTYVAMLRKNNPRDIQVLSFYWR